MSHSEVEVTAELVHDLLRDQHPDLAELPVTFGARGWGNQLWRLGDELAVRLPWMGETSDRLLLKEHTWVPTLAPGLPIPVPVPQRLGEPSGRFPHPWLVTTWVPGIPADRAPVTDGPAGADALAAFLGALHRPAPTGAPAGEGRGGPLCEVAEGVAGSLADAAELGLIPDHDAARAILDDAVGAPPWTEPPVWLHGDLHPANVLTQRGALCGVVDFGDMCAGDPALDIAACWILLPDAAAIRRFQTGLALRADHAAWRRARGWAVGRALACLFIADSARHGHPGAKPTWGPPALASLRRLTASAAA